MSTITKDGDNIYLNVVFDNNSPVTAPVAELAYYNVTKNIPILSKSSDYYCSVIRFDIPLNEVPLFIMPIIPNQANADKTPLIVGIEYLATDYSQNLIFTPEILTEAIPVQNSTSQIITPYYYVYDYDLLVQMANRAVYDACVAAGNPGGANNSPFFTFNPVTQLIELYVSQAFVASGANIYWNELFNNYFGQSFRTNYLGASDHAYEMVIVNATGNINSYAPFIVAASIDPAGATPQFPYGGTSPQATAWYKFTQNFSTVSYWSSLRKIIIASNTIPILSEIVPSHLSGSQSGITSSFPIITDFVPNIDQSNQSRSIAYYYPTSQYRLVDMIGDGPLNKIDLQIYWQDKNGNMYPLYISPLQQASIKIAFIRKSLYKPGNTLLLK